MARPLAGKRMLVTRASEQAAEFSREIIRHGGIPVELPVISFRRSEGSREIERTFERLSAFQWIVFTSSNGVRFFFERLHERQIVFPTEAKVAVVGEKTAGTLQRYGVRADVIPGEFVAESLILKLRPEVKPGDEVLLARGNLARSILPEALTKAGAHVTDLIVYHTVRNREIAPKLADLLKNDRLDVVTFTSSSTAHHFFDILKRMNIREAIDRVKIACIGPVTARTVKDNGLEPDIIADEYTVPGLLAALEQYFGEGFA